MTIIHDGTQYECCDEYSSKDFTGSYPLPDLSGRTIYNTCFSCETPDTKRFPDEMTGVTFLECILDNVFLPPGNIIVGPEPKRFLAQNDGNDWLVDENNKPVEILNSLSYIKAGLDLPRPEDLPEKFIVTQIISRTEYNELADEINYGMEYSPSNFREIPEILETFLVFDERNNEHEFLKVQGWAWICHGVR